MATLTTGAMPRSNDGMRSSRSRPEARQTNGFAHYITRPILNAGPLLFASAVIFVLLTAWFYRDEGYLTAESGTGYWLGIIGGVIMLLLIAYPIRKRLPGYQRLGRIASWFRLHMIFGILGPSLVVLHTNFKLGSLNSRLALFTMLIVVASGIVGRYLYAKVHRGLYGQHAALRDVLTDITALKIGLEAALGNDGEIVAQLEAFAPTPDRAQSVLSGLASCLTSGLRTSAARSRILRRAHLRLRAEGQLPAKARRRLERDLRGHLRLYFAAVKKAERLALFERIFGLWHHLHMPLFILLALTVTLHIIAVHRY